MNTSDLLSSKTFSESDAKVVLEIAETCKFQARQVLDAARKVTHIADSSILDASYQSNFLPTRFRHGTRLELTSMASTTTGGHSNTDHIVSITGDPQKDALSEYKRALMRRAKAMQPEERGKERWDQPRVVGVRRRRIIRESDLPTAPPEPPPSGYVIYVGQMTTKIRHDRPHVHHNQVEVVKEISYLWKNVLSKNEKNYYNYFAKEAREEYERQHTEFRATGSFQPSTKFEKLQGDGPWVKVVPGNTLEEEISSYDSVKFAPRPQSAKIPSWVEKVKQQNERERERKEQRDKRKEEIRKRKIEQLKADSEAKKKRLMWDSESNVGEYGL